MSYRLAMSAEIRAWLAGLRDEDAEAARLVGQALGALTERGAELGPPVVIALDGSLPPDALRDRLDQEYGRMLDRVSGLRRDASPAPAAGEQAPPEPADLAELFAAQSEAEAFRAKKEVLKARSVTAQMLREIDPDDEAAAVALAESTELMCSELGEEALADGLLELRPGAPGGGDLVIIFAVQPAGTALLISVLAGPAAGEHRGLATSVSADVLRRVRAGQDHAAAECRYDDAGSLLRMLFGDGDGGGGGGGGGDGAG